MPNWKARPGKGAIYFNGEFCGRASSSSKLEPLIKRSKLAFLNVTFLRISKSSKLYAGNGTS